MHHFITGVAGFIGSHLADSLLADGHRVSGMDDFSLGRREFLAQARTNGVFHLVDGDCSVSDNVRDALSVVTAWGGAPDLVWHMAANSDIAAGASDAALDFRRTLQTTSATLDGARAAGVRRFAFASSSAVYGERDDFLTEDSGPLLPISNYGAAKLGSEGLVSAAAENVLESAWIFRLPNVAGPRLTHGAIFDFVRRLALEPARLGCAIAVGPHTGNFIEHGTLLREADAMREVPTPAELAAFVSEMLDHPDRARAMGERAAAIAERHVDLPDRAAAAILSLIIGRSGG